MKITFCDGSFLEKEMNPNISIDDLRKGMIKDFIMFDTKDGLLIIKMSEVRSIEI